MNIVHQGNSLRPAINKVMCIWYRGRVREQERKKGKTNKLLDGEKVPDCSDLIEAIGKPLLLTLN